MKLFYGFIISRIVIVLIIFFIITISFNETTISSGNPSSQILLKGFIPEGWAFFTRNPKEEDYIPYVYKNKKLSKIERYPIFSEENSWGFDRGYKAISMEVAATLKKVNQQDWNKKNNYNLTEIKDSIYNVKIIKTTFKYPVLLDTICVIAIEPIPWAWNSISSQQDYPCKYIYIKIEK